MSTVESVVPIHQASNSRRVVVVAGLVGALACLTYASSVVFLPDLGPGSSLHPLVFTANVIATLAFMTLAITLPALARVIRGPRWAALVAAAGCAFIAVITWTTATYIPHVMAFLSVDQERQVVDSSSLYFDLYSAPKIILVVVGMVALAIAAWRRRSFSRGACVILILAAIGSLLAPPWPGGVLVGIGLAWAAATAHPTDRSQY